MHRFYFIAALPVTLILTGCATSALDKDEAKKYASLEVDQFVKERFIEKESVLGALNSGASKFSKMLDGGRDAYHQQQAEAHRNAYEYEKKMTGLQDDGISVIYNAYYNDMNNDQLYRPKTELEYFCNAQKGSFRAEQIYNKNFVSAAFKNPSDAFEEAMKTSYSGAVTVGLGPVAITHSMNDFKSTIAQSEAEQVVRYNEKADRKGAELGYMDAANAGSFGRFICENISQDMQWHVTIVPFTFRSKDPSNGMSTHKMKILIIPEKHSKA
jgi:hypothetical protein